MKRFIFLIIASVVTGKVVGAYLNDIAGRHVPKIHKGVSAEQGTDEGLRMGEIPDHFDPRVAGHPPLVNAPRLALAPVVAAAKPAVAAPTKVAAAEDAKKKKKKEDEEKEKKVADAKKVTAPAPYVQPLAPQYAQYGYPQNQYNNAAYYGGPITVPAASAAAPVTATAAATPLKPAAGATATNSNVNLTTWINSLVNQPSESEMQQFVALYTSGKVTEAQFFTVMADMQKSSVVESRSLLVQTLNTMKKSESFHILSDVSATDSDGTVRAAALQAVDSYNSVSYLTILSTALSSNDTNEAINGSIDVQVIAQAAQQNVTPATQNLFKPFVQILENLTQSTNTNLRQYASSALTSVEAIVGTSVAGN